MQERLELGPAPAEEACVEIGHPDYQRLARQECLAYIQAIKRVCGEPPEGARFKVGSHSHDFGLYYEVEVVYDPENEAAARYAQKCDEQAPSTWAEANMQAPGAIQKGR